MADVTNELLYEVLKAMQGRFVGVERGIKDIKSEIGALRGHMVATQADIAQIYTRLAETESHLERIERRFEVSGIPTA